MCRGRPFAMSAVIIMIMLMTDEPYRWAPPEHPDPPEDQPLGIPADPTATPVDLAPVTVSVDFTRTGRVDVPGFVEQAGVDRVYVQLVHMGFAHRVWLPRDRVRTRQLKPRR
jgi:hypothetical protein